jgi:hypothetical protein
MFLGTLYQCATVRLDLETGDGVPVPYLEHQPAFENFLQIVPGLLQRIRVCPNTLQAGDFAKVITVRKNLILGPALLFRDVFRQHHNLD